MPRTPVLARGPAARGPRRWREAVREGDTRLPAQRAAVAHLLCLPAAARLRLSTRSTVAGDGCAIPLCLVSSNPSSFLAMQPLPPCPVLELQSRLQGRAQPFFCARFPAFSSSCRGPVCTRPPSPRGIDGGPAAPPSSGSLTRFLPALRSHAPHARSRQQEPGGALGCRGPQRGPAVLRVLGAGHARRLAGSACRARPGAVASVRRRVGSCLVHVCRRAHLSPRMSVREEARGGGQWWCASHSSALL